MQFWLHLGELLCSTLDFCAGVLDRPWKLLPMMASAKIKKY